MPLPFDVLTLPRLLANAGYATQLIHDTPHLVNGGHAFDWPFAAWTFVRGAEVDRPWIDEKGLTYLDNWARDPLFDYIDDAEMSGAGGRMVLTYARANRNRKDPEEWNVAQLFLKGAEFIRDNASRDRFLLWLDCFDPHEPWDAPPDFVKQYDSTPNYDGRIDPRAFLGAARHAHDGAFPPGVRERQVALYAAKVSWVDHWFGHVLDALQETGLDQNTAILLTSDHGTNLGERGGFGKTWTVNEQEAHVPLLIALPGGTSGRCSDLVQPQDISATILGLAGVPAPAGFVGFDLLAGPERTPRTHVIAGSGVNGWQPGANGWHDDPKRTAFTVFDGDWYLNIAADPAACRLYRRGSVQDVASKHPDVAARMRQAGLETAAERDLDPRLLDWLHKEGTVPFPEECTAWPGPPQWRTYWERVYVE
jgi:arylsulfatase A-like enzyme